MPATFSICIPLYNGGTTIEADPRRRSSPRPTPTGSASSSTTPPPTTAWCGSDRVDDPRITVQAMPDNVGMTANWNRALATADGALTPSSSATTTPSAPTALATLRRDVRRRTPTWRWSRFGAIVPRDDGPDLHHARRHLGRIEPAVLREFALRTSDTPAPSQVAYRTSVLRAVPPARRVLPVLPRDRSAVPARVRPGTRRSTSPTASASGGNDPTASPPGCSTPPCRSATTTGSCEKHGPHEPVGRRRSNDAGSVRQRPGWEIVRALRRGRLRSALSFVKTVVVGERRIPR